MGRLPCRLRGGDAGAVSCLDGRKIQSVRFALVLDEEAMPKLEVQRVRFSEQLEYLQSIKEVQFFNDIPDKSRETFPQEIREQLDNKNKQKGVEGVPH